MRSHRTRTIPQPQRVRDGVPSDITSYYFAKSRSTENGGTVTDSSIRDIDFAPEHGADLPSVTMPMLVDFFSQTEILYKPDPLPKRIFQWFAAVSRETVECVAPSTVSDAHLLFVCGADEAEALLRTLFPQKPIAIA